VQNAGGQYINDKYRDVAQLFEWKFYKSVKTIRNMASHLGQMLDRDHHINDEMYLFFASYIQMQRILLK